MFNISTIQPFTVPHGTIGVDATVQVKLIPPWVHPTGGPFNYSRSPRKFGSARTVVTKVCYTTGDTAHVLTIARPFNWTYISGAVLKNTSTLVLADDPGVYSTNYKYALGNGGIPSSVADNGIATNDYIVVQLADGTWHLTKVSVSTLTLTLTTALPNPTGVGGVLDGAICYFYGNLTSDTDPATGFANPRTTIALSTTRDVTWADSAVGIVDALHPGDPLVWHCPHTTHAGTLEYINGYFASVNG